MRTSLLLLVLALLSGCSPEAAVEPIQDPVIVTANVQSTHISPGRPFTLTIEVNRREDVQFDLPDLGAEIRGLVIQDIENDGEERAGGRVLTRTKYKLKAPISGTYVVPGVEAPWKSEAHEVGTAGTGPILLEASHAAGEEGSGTAELRDIKPPAPPDPKLSPWLWALGLLATAAIALFLVLRRRKEEAVPPPPPADRVALDALAALARSEWLGAEDQGPFAYEVSAILRRYLEERFVFGAWRMTTAEVLRSLPHEVLAKRKIETSVREVLEASDLVKFAGERVGREVLEGWIDQAKTVVRATGIEPGLVEAALGDPG